MYENSGSRAGRHPVPARPLTGHTHPVSGSTSVELHGGPTVTFEPRNSTVVMRTTQNKQRHHRLVAPTSLLELPESVQLLEALSAATEVHEPTYAGVGEHLCATPVFCFPTEAAIATFPFPSAFTSFSRTSAVFGPIPPAVVGQPRTEESSCNHFAKVNDENNDNQPHAVVSFVPKQESPLAQSPFVIDRAILAQPCLYN